MYTYVCLFMCIQSSFAMAPILLLRNITKNLFNQLIKLVVQ